MREGASPPGGLAPCRGEVAVSAHGQAAKAFILLKLFFLSLWDAMSYLLKAAAFAAITVTMKEGAMDVEDTKRGSHPPADLIDCLGTGIKGIVSDIEEVNPRDVLDDIRMPHFAAPCPKSHILTAKDAEGHHHLLHNRQLLDAALGRGDGTIRTEFYAVPWESGVALMAVRFSLPFCANGEVSYSEHLRNIRVIEDELDQDGRGALHARR